MTRVRIGDVAAIPLGDDKVAYAHVLGRHELLDYYAHGSIKAPIAV